MLKIGSRNSKLALAQAKLVVDKIKEYYPEIEVKIIPIITTGDRIQDINLYEIGGKALFLKELEEALLEGAIDIAVHSLKDVPGRINDLFKIAAMLERANPADVLVSKHAKTIHDLPLKARVGTSSVRRKLILENLRPDLEVVTFRGNVDSRLNKIMQGEVDAAVLAYAGLERINLFNANYCNIIPSNLMIPAPGQGIIAVEILKHCSFTNEICTAINHQPTWETAMVERAFVDYLNADCKTPLGAYAYSLEGRINANFMLANNDASKIYYHHATGDLNNSSEIGITAAKILKSKI